MVLECAGLSLDSVASGIPEIGAAYAGCSSMARYNLRGCNGALHHTTAVPTPPHLYGGPELLSSPS